MDIFRIDFSQLEPGEIYLPVPNRADGDGATFKRLADGSVSIRYFEPAETDGSPNECELLIPSQMWRAMVEALDRAEGGEAVVTIASDLRQVSELRQVFVRHGDGDAFHRCRLADIKAGDIFEMFEPEQGPQRDKVNRWRAMEDAVQNELTGVWAVQAQPRYGDYGDVEHVAG
jgi:hypothetical protein